MNWRDLVLICIKDLCDNKKKAVFTLEELYTYKDKMHKYYPANNHIEEKIRQQLQYLREENIVIFIDYEGTYKLG